MNETGWEDHFADAGKKISFDDEINGYRPDNLITKEVTKALLDYSYEMTRFCNLLLKQLDLVLKRGKLKRESIEYIRDIVDCKYKGTIQYQTILNLENDQ